MAKRKRKPGRGSRLRSVKDYRDDEYVPYIFRVEGGILEAWTIDPDIRDGDVRDALRSLISPLKKTGQLPPELAQETDSSEAANDQSKVASKGTKSFLRFFVLSNLRAAFEEHGSLSAEETLGILTVVNNSVGAWNRGMRGQEYLKYIKDFLGGMGVEVRQLSDEEVEKLGLTEPKNLIEGEYDELD